MFFSPSNPHQPKNMPIQSAVRFWDPARYQSYSVILLDRTIPWNPWVVSTPLKNISWDDYSQYMEKQNMFQTTTKLTVDGLVLNSFRRKVHCFYLREVLMFLPCKHIGHPLPPCGSGCDGGGVVMQFGSQQILGLSLGMLLVKLMTGPFVYIHLYIYIHTIMCM